MQRVTQYLGYVALRICICIAQTLRLETCEAISDSAAFLLTTVVPLRRKVIDDNLRHAYPEVSARERRRTARAMWRHLILFVFEIAHAPRKIHETNWRRYVRMGKCQEMVRAIFDDRPTILVSAHHGNFEVAGFVNGILGFPTFTVARALDNPYIDRFVNQFRGLTGQYIIPKKGGYEQIIEVLDGGGTMVFLADQYAGTKACWVDFFGRPASVHKAIALLALNHGARLAVGGSRRLGGPLQYEMTADAVIDTKSGAPEVQSVQALTEWYTSHLERHIRRAPQEYWWLHRRWKDHRPAKRKRSRHSVPTASSPAANLL